VETSDLTRRNDRGNGSKNGTKKEKRRGAVWGGMGKFYAEPDREQKQKRRIFDSGILHSEPKEVGATQLCLNVIPLGFHGCVLTALLL
jgi:hypothetical protein